MFFRSSPERKRGTSPIILDPPTSLRYQHRILEVPSASARLGMTPRSFAPYFIRHHGPKIENQESKIDCTWRDRFDRRLQISRAGQFAGETKPQCFCGDDK